MELRNLLGLPIYDTTMPKLLNELSYFIKNDKKKTIFGISTGAIGRLKKRRDLARIYNEFDINIAEGNGIPLLAKIFGLKISEKIGLVNLTNNLIEEANRNNYKIQFFGSTTKVLKSLEYNLNQKYPYLEICESINGFFEEHQIDKIIDKINEASPDILFIGITYPIKERFTVKYKDKLNAKLIVPCGGAFEVLAGKVKRPPFEIKYFPTAWFYRFIQEPRRLFNMVLLNALYTIFFVIPVLYIKHITRIERNPSIIKFFNISLNEWDPKNGSIKH